MATFSIPKRMKIFTESNEVNNVELYDSDQDYNPEDDVDEISSSTSLTISDDDATDASGSSSSSMEISGYVRDNPNNIFSKDRTRWNEDVTMFQNPESNQTCLEDHIPKLTERTQEAHSLIEIFKLFLPDELSIHILDMSNIKLKTFLDSHPEFLDKRYYQLITLPELLAFFGLMIEIGALSLSRESLDNLYCEDTNKSKPIFKAVMPRDRFTIILRFLRFYDASTRVERQKTDNLAAIRSVVDSLKTNLLANYLSGQWVTVDEHLCRYRGKEVLAPLIGIIRNSYAFTFYHHSLKKSIDSNSLVLFKPPVSTGFGVANPITSSSSSVNISTCTSNTTCTPSSHGITTCATTSCTGTDITTSSSIAISVTSTGTSNTTISSKTISPIAAIILIANSNSFICIYKSSSAFDKTLVSYLHVLIFLNFFRGHILNSIIHIFCCVCISFKYVEISANIMNAIIYSPIEYYECYYLLSY